MPNAPWKQARTTFNADFSEHPAASASCNPRRFGSCAALEQAQPEQEERHTEGNIRTLPQAARVLRQGISRRKRRHPTA